MSPYKNPGIRVDIGIVLRFIIYNVCGVMPDALFLTRHSQLECRQARRGILTICVAVRTRKGAGGWTLT